MIFYGPHCFSIIKILRPAFFLSMSYADVIKITQFSKFPNNCFILFLYSLNLLVAVMGIIHFIFFSSPFGNILLKERSFIILVNFVPRHLVLITKSKWPECRKHFCLRHVLLCYFWRALQSSFSVECQFFFFFSLNAYFSKEKAYYVHTRLLLSVKRTKFLCQLKNFIDS